MDLTSLQHPNSLVVLFYLFPTSLDPDKPENAACMRSALTAMLKNYLIVALRNFRNHKAYSLINVIGLGAGTGASILILLYVYNVVTADRFHAQADDIYFVHRMRPSPEGDFKVYDTWYPLLTELESEYPAVRDGFRLLYDTRWIGYGEQRMEEEVAFTDASLFTMLDIPIVRGSRESAMPDRSSIVLSEEMAAKYFGDDDPIGKALTLNFDQEYFVSAVMGALPPNSAFSFDFIAPLASLSAVMEAGWDRSFLLTFVLLQPGTNPAQLEAQFPPFVDRMFVPAERGDMKLIPLADFGEEFTPRRDTAYLLLLIALGILLIAAINFTNLATARSMRRAREIGMRKVVGATRQRLMRQFLAESILMSFLALFIGIGIAALLMPAFNAFVEMDLRLDFLASPILPIGLVALALLTGILAGIYPAIVLSGFRPAIALKGTSTAKPGGRWVRNGLVVGQFAMTMILLMGIGVMHRQIQHMKTEDLRFDRENVVVISTSLGDFEDREAAANRITAFRNELHSVSGISEVAASDVVPGRYSNVFTLLQAEGQDDRPPLDWRFAFVDADYFSTYNMQFVDGDNFNPDLGAGPAQGVIINEAALRQIGWDSGTGRNLVFGEMRVPIVGVVRDFHYESLQNLIEPALHFYGGEWRSSYQYVSVKLHHASVAAAMSRIQEMWNRVDATRPMEYFFVDDNFRQFYRAEENMMAIVSYAGILAILIACLGLLGMASYAAMQRTKEVGIRKVLGASTSSVASLLVRQFSKPVLIGILIAPPVAWYLLDLWLQNFPYRTSIDWWIPVLAALFALGIAFATVASQAVRAAVRNPVEALRYE